MSRKNISVRVMKAVIKDLGGVFATKDVSEDERMINAHPRLVKHSHYHAFVGGALSDHRAKLDIKEIQKQTLRGSRWQKKRYTPEPSPKIILDHHQEDRKINKGKFEKTFTLICPSCGGKLQTKEDMKHFICDHCGNEHIIN